MLATDLTEQQIHTIHLPLSDKTYQLKASHIATKEVREWFWTSFWWSEAPHGDLGADRPASISPVGAGRDQYKMCVAQGFEDADPAPGAAFAVTAPDLSQALAAIADAAKGLAPLPAHPLCRAGRARGSPPMGHGFGPPACG